MTSEMLRSRFLYCPDGEHVDGRDHYQERVDLGECAWCEQPYDRTVCFETCDHATPTCEVHFDEYFSDTEWMPEVYLDPMCPECYG
jgi:hypothetical protein